MDVFRSVFRKGGKVSTEQRDILLCFVCKTPIQDLSESIRDESAGTAYHFECFGNSQEAERLSTVVSLPRPTVSAATTRTPRSHVNVSPSAELASTPNISITTEPASSLLTSVDVTEASPTPVRPSLNSPVSLRTLVPPHPSQNHQHHTPAPSDTNTEDRKDVPAKPQKAKLKLVIPSSPHCPYPYFETPRPKTSRINKSNLKHKTPESEPPTLRQTLAPNPVTMMMATTTSASSSPSSKGTNTHNLKLKPFSPSPFRFHRSLSLSANAIPQVKSRGSARCGKELPFAMTPRMPSDAKLKSSVRARWTWHGH